MANEKTGEEKLLSTKVKLLEEIEGHNRHMLYGVRVKAKKAFEHVILKKAISIEDNKSKITSVEIAKEDWDVIVDFIRFVKDDTWDGFGGFPDSEILAMNIKKEILKSLG